MRLIALLMLAVAFATLMFVVSLTFFNMTVNYKIEPLPAMPTNVPKVNTTTIIINKAKSTQTLKYLPLIPKKRDDVLHVVILACNRRIELNMSMFALTQVYEKHLLNITVSLDCAESFLNIFPVYRHEFGALQVVDSYQRHVAVDDWRDERVARHWLSAITRMFESAPNIEHVLYMEEDHVVMPDIYVAANKYKNTCKDCFAINLACHKPCYGRFSRSPHAIGKAGIANIGVLYIRKQWLQFLKSKALSLFCSLRGDWDINMKGVTSKELIPKYNLQLLKPRVYHLHDCVSARTGKTWKKSWCGVKGRERIYREFVDDWQKYAPPSNKSTPFVYVEKGTLNPKAPPLMEKRCLEAVHHD